MPSSLCALNLSQHQGLFSMSRLFTSDDQNTGASASGSVLPVHIQGLSPLRLTGLISLLPKGVSRVFSSTTVWRHQFFGVLPSSRSSCRNHTWPLGRPYIALTIQTFVGRVMSLLFNTLSRFVITFLPRNKHLLILWLQSLSAVILEPKRRKYVTTFMFSPYSFHVVMGPDAMILVFFFFFFFVIFSLKLALSLSSFTLIKRPFSSSLLSAIRVVSSTHLRLLMFLPHFLIPACNLFSPAFLMMCSECRLNKQGDSRQPVVLLSGSWTNYFFDTAFKLLLLYPYTVSQETGKMAWIPISLRIFQFVLIHTVKGFNIVSETELDVFLKFPCFLYNPANVGIWSLVPLPFLNLAWISGISWFT